jgi:hypothetical protein
VHFILGLIQKATGSGSNNGFDGVVSSYQIAEFSKNYPSGMTFGK